MKTRAFLTLSFAVVLFLCTGCPNGNASQDATDLKTEPFQIIGTPPVITLESELAENTRISDEAKQLWTMINRDNAVTGNMPAPFQELRDSRKNGFEAIFREENDRGGYVSWRLTYTMLTANDGRKIAYVWKRFNDRSYADMPQPLTPEWEQYIYQDGLVRRVEPEIPKPKLTDFPAYNLGDKTVSMEGKGSSIYLDCTGYFKFYPHSDAYQSFGDTETDAEVKYYLIFYKWDGEKFVCETSI